MSTEICDRDGCDNAFERRLTQRFCKDEACVKSRQQAKASAQRDDQHRDLAEQQRARARRQRAMLRELTQRLEDNKLKYPRGLLPVRIKAIARAERAGDHAACVGALLDLAAVCVAAAVDV